MKFSCPKCAGHIDASPEWASQSIDCPHCQASITAPAEVGQFQKSAILEFSRPWALSGCARTFNVYVDGAKVAMLKNGKSQNIPVPAGTHEVAGGMGKKHGCVFSIEAGPADHLPLKAQATTNDFA